MVLDNSLLNTQRYKVRIKGKMEQSRGRSCALGVVTTEKGAFGSPSTSVANFTFLLLLHTKGSYQQKKMMTRFVPKYFDVNKTLSMAEYFTIMKFRNCKFNIT